MDEWNTKSLTTFEKWSEISEFVQSECILLKNIKLILEFSFAIPGNSVAVEEYFISQMLCGLMKRAVPLLKPKR
jgi:hypothetical protein